MLISIDLEIENEKVVDICMIAVNAKNVFGELAALREQQLDS